MNDFTKEELQYLFKTFSLTEGSKFEHDLDKKIQSMIDNYCEHEFHPVIGSFQIESCHKCMRVK